MNQDIALTGFDDIEDVKFSSPPLTSVHQPLRQMAEKGTKMLIDLIAGKSVEDQVLFPAYPVIRQSCGCLPLPEKMGTARNAERALLLKEETGSFCGKMGVDSHRA